ncbi:nucleolar protein 10 isoform X1 [Synchiropus splendidus]|uniref:nucleolar protein 10 isoform X1 n=1 Tax=Synchiropus splendidus TaxID=270530 RepID=UPI00237D5578|nr:nucleolar protein 10 isoform X1 [Synchiropus splendidus]
MGSLCRSGCQTARRDSYKRKMSTSNVGSSSSRTLRCPQCAPPLKYPGMDNTSLLQEHINPESAALTRTSCPRSLSAAWIRRVTHHNFLNIKQSLSCLSSLILKQFRLFKVVAFDILSDDYSKLVFLLGDRYIEFHSQHGYYYRTRIPKFGRDFSYHYPSCDLFFVGASSEVFRLNLEQGRFLSSLQTDAVEINVCDINPVHHLLATGTSEGKVECWDPRVRTRVGMLDCALSSLTEGSEVHQLPAISSLKFNGSLSLAVGTSTGQVLLYDLRSGQPLIVKDHFYNLPIKSLNFHDPMDLVVSADSKIIKMWNKDSAKIFSTIEPKCNINDVCIYPQSGMLFTANEDPKMNTFYIPALGPAPKWCSFLDNLTEELEESPECTVYDDYKFVTRKDLDNLGLSHLVGSSLLRAYMHGYFMDIRLYHKVKQMANPFAYEEYRKDKIRQKIEESRTHRVQLKKLPAVNKELALKLMQEGDEEDQLSSRKKKGKAAPTILGDDRFKVMFENPDYQVDEQSEEFRLLNPIVSKVGQKRKKKLRLLAKQMEASQKEAGDDEDEEEEGRASSDEESSDDDKSWVEEVREQRRLLHQEHRQRRWQQRKEEDRNTILLENQQNGEETSSTARGGNTRGPQFYQLKSGEEFRSFNDLARKQKLQKASLGERLKLEEHSGASNTVDTAVGSKQLTFTLKKSEQQRKQQQAERDHHEERRKLRRSAGHLSSARGRGRGRGRGRY